MWHEEGQRKMKMEMERKRKREVWGVTMDTRTVGTPGLD
jgi:hypothetical protein